MTNPASRTSDEERFTLFMLGVGSLGAIGGVLAATWSRVLGWLLEHQVLVAAAHHPLLVLPRCAGAGVDESRLALAVAAVLVLSVSAVATVRRRLAIWAAERELQ